MRPIAWLIGAATLPLLVVGVLVERSAAVEMDWAAELCQAASEAEQVLPDARIDAMPAAVPADATGAEVGLLRTTLKLMPQAGGAAVDFIVPGGKQGTVRQVIGADVLGYLKAGPAGSTVLAIKSKTRDPLQPSGRIWVQIVGDNGQKFGAPADEVEQALAELAPRTSGLPRNLLQRPGGAGVVQAGERIEVPDGGVVLSFKSAAPRPAESYRLRTWDRVIAQAKHCARGGGQ